MTIIRAMNAVLFSTYCPWPDKPGLSGAVATGPGGCYNKIEVFVISHLFHCLFSSYSVCIKIAYEPVHSYSN
jgi:hypothetical protein